MKLKSFYVRFMLCFQIVLLTTTCAFWIHSYDWEDSLTLYNKSSDFLWISSTGGMVSIARGHESGRIFDGTLMYGSMPGGVLASEFGVPLHRWHGLQWAKTTIFSNDAHVIWVAHWLIALVAAAFLSRRVWLMLKPRRERARGFEPLPGSSSDARENA